MGQGNAKNKYRLSGDWSESSPEEKGLGVLVDKKLHMTPQFALPVQKANHIPGCIKSRMARRLTEGILPLCSTLVIPHRESCVQLWGSQHRRHMDLLERGQGRPQKWSEGWSTSPMRKA